jgi:hypothetical protein
VVLSRALALSLALSVSLVSLPALADPRDEAKALADSAYGLLQRGLYDEAIELFRKADERFHSPVFVLYIAEAEQKRGRLLAAKELLEAVRDEPLGPDATDAFRQARDDATTRLADLERRIPRITIVVSAPRPAKVTLDGVPVAALDVPIPVDPGLHEVIAELEGVEERRTVELGERQKVEVALSLRPETPSPEPASEGIPSWVWPAAGYGVGVAGLFMAGIAGGIFLSRQADLKDSCAPGDPNRCPPDQADEIETVQTLGNIATAGWVIAAAGVAAGTILVFALDHDAEVAVAPNGLALRGRF